MLRLGKKILDAINKMSKAFSQSYGLKFHSFTTAGASSEVKSCSMFETLFLFCYHFVELEVRAPVVLDFHSRIESSAFTFYYEGLPSAPKISLAPRPLTLL